jgi:hypothetical protein
MPWAISQMLGGLLRERCGGLGARQVRLSVYGLILFCYLLSQTYQGAEGLDHSRSQPSTSPAPNVCGRERTMFDLPDSDS